ncbi:hypothetical protein [Micromonospora sp. KC606]|uniref:hypothetical protein n=1 Tax=Micromonospora sp. KC606 TaxID=2530379 RepID=UPI001FB76BB1|nr:hypothetical protein [Micromonospora sp. KC606]
MGLFVALVLAPLNPTRTVRRVADPALDLFAREMTESAAALATGDAERAERVLDRMRAVEPELTRLSEIVGAAEEVVRLSPLWWRRRRALAAYRAGAEHMERAFRNSRTLVRRIGAALRAGEPVPAGLPSAVEYFGEAVRLLHREFLPRGSRCGPGSGYSPPCGRPVRPAGRRWGSPARSSSRSFARPPTTCCGPPECPGTRPGGWFGVRRPGTR